jgi:hypothetical protein
MAKSNAAAAFVTLFLASGLQFALAQAPQPAVTKQVRVETQLSKMVVFINVELKSLSPSATSLQPVTLAGTGFLISLPDGRLDSGKGFGYLVTNRHVAQAIEQDGEGNCTAHEVQQTYVTMNLKQAANGNRSKKVPITMSQDVHWYFLEDDAIDLAVIPFVAATEFDAVPLSVKDFLTADAIEKQNVVPGDRLLTPGYFFAYAGMHQIQPILREGVLAMLPDGPMRTTLCKSGNVYLADVHITPGNSGSPIFIIPSLGLGAGEAFGGVPSVFGLLGVVSGYMQETSELTLRASTTWQASVEANSGVSVVVPAQQLIDLLDSPGLQRLRDKQLARIRIH